MIGGRKIRNYIIYEEICDTNMSTVFRGFDTEIGRTVAIKVIKEKSFEYNRFRKELEIINSLENKHIVPLYGIGEFEKKPYIVMRYMKGGSLKDRLEKGSISFAESLRILRIIASILDIVHKKNIVHGDIKPANIVFDEYDEPYLIDFGISRHFDTTTSISGNLPFTAAYMSPEQARGNKNIDWKSDIYSLGAMLFHMLTGQMPYEADSSLAVAMKHIHDPIPQINQFNDQLNSRIQMLINKSMAKDHDERYEKASELVDDLEACMKIDEDTGTDKNTDTLPDELHITDNSNESVPLPTFPKHFWIFETIALFFIFVLIIKSCSKIPTPEDNNDIFTTTVTQTKEATTTNTLTPVSRSIIQPDVNQAIITLTPTSSKINTNYKNCTNNVPPCNYLIKNGDNYSQIASNLYGGFTYTYVIMNFNRYPDGSYRRLFPDNYLFIPDLNKLPELDIPDCKKNQSFPCQHTVSIGDTYVTIASYYYGDPNLTNCIGNNNLIYSPSSNKLKQVYLKEGIKLVIPLKTACH